MVRERQEKYEVDDKTHKGDSEKVCCAQLLLFKLYPQRKDMLKCQTQVPQNMSLFGNRVFTEVVK